MALYQIIFSPTGGTQKCAAPLLRSFHQECRTIDLSEPEGGYGQYRFTEEDICIIAVPSYGGRVPAAAASRLQLMSGNGADAILCVAYGNRAYDDTLLELKDLLSACGFVCCAAVAAVAEHSIMRQFGAGRPDAEDCRQLTAFGEQIAQVVCSGRAAGELKVPGSFPYRRYGGVPLKPKAGKSCTGCGLCAASCPVGAIPKETPSDTDHAACISCMRCLRVCPNAARSVNRLALTAASQKLQKACCGRKPNELFL